MGVLRIWNVENLTTSCGQPNFAVKLNRFYTTPCMLFVSLALSRCFVIFKITMYNSLSSFARAANIASMFNKIWSCLISKFCLLYIRLQYSIRLTSIKIVSFSQFKLSALYQISATPYINRLFFELTNLIGFITVKYVRNVAVSNLLYTSTQVSSVAVLNPYGIMCRPD